MISLVLSSQKKTREMPKPSTCSQEGNQDMTEMYKIKQSVDKVEKEKLFEPEITQ